MNAKKLRAKSATELQTLKTELNKEQFNLRMQQGVKSHLLKQARRNVARVNTLLTEKGAK